MSDIQRTFIVQFEIIGTLFVEALVSVKRIDLLVFIL